MAMAHEPHAKGAAPAAPACPECARLRAENAKLRALLEQGREVVLRAWDAVLQEPERSPQTEGPHHGA